MIAGEEIRKQILIGVDVQFHSGVFQIELLEKGIFVEVHLHETHLFLVDQGRDLFVVDMIILHGLIAHQLFVFQAIREVVVAGHRRIRICLLHCSVDNLSNVDTIESANQTWMRRFSGQNVSRGGCGALYSC